MIRHQHNPLFRLVVNYETSKREGTNSFFKEEDYNRLIDYFEFEFLYTEALDVTTQAIEKYPYSVEFLFRKIHLHIFAEEYSNATEVLEKAAAFVPGSLDVKLHRAWISAETGIFDNSFDILTELKSELTDKKELSLVYYYEAMVFEHRKELDKAFSSLAKAIELDPSNAEALEKIWWCMNRLGNHEQTIEFFRAVVEIEPFSWWGWFNLASALEFSCKHMEAIEAYEFAIAADPKKEQAYRSCIEVCFNLKKYDLALRVTEDILRRFEPDADLYMKAGVCKLETGKIAAAKKFFAMAQMEDECNEEIYHLLGECSRKEGKFKQAIHFYKKAISLYPFREEYYQHLADAYFQMGKPLEAKSYYKRAADVGSDVLNNWSIYFEFLYNIEDIPAALKVIDEAMIYHEDSMMLKYYRIAYVIALGKLPEGLYYLQDALEEDFDSHISLFDAHPELLQNSKVKDFIINFREKQLTEF